MADKKEEKPHRYPILQDGGLAAYRSIQRDLLKQIDHSDSPGAATQAAVNIGLFADDIDNSPELRRQKSLIRHNFEHGLRQDVAKALGHLKGDTIVADHYHFNVKDKISIDDKTTLKVKDVLTKQFASRLLSSIKQYHSGEEKVFNEYLKRFGDKIGDETSQRVLAKMMDQYHGIKEGSNGSFTQLMAGLQQGAFDDEKLDGLYQTIDSALIRAHSDLGKNVRKSLNERLGYKHNILDPNQPKILEGIAAESGGKLVDSIKAQDQGVDRMGDRLYDAITENRDSTRRRERQSDSVVAYK